jgi:hypothetical protein
MVINQVLLVTRGSGEIGHWPAAEWVSSDEEHGWIVRSFRLRTLGRGTEMLVMLEGNNAEGWMS